MRTTETDEATGLTVLTVNAADWDGPDGIEAAGGWLIVNAPRPLLGEHTWTGPFRHGTFYAVGPAPADVPEGFDRRIAEGRVRSWKADDAWLIRFTTNDEVRAAVLAKFAEYGYASVEEAGVTIAEQAACMDLPWHEEGSDRR